MFPNNSGSNEPNPGQTDPLIATYTQREIYSLVQKEFIYFKKNYDKDAYVMFTKRKVPLHSGVVKNFKEKDFSSFASTKPEGSPAKRANFGLGYHKNVWMKRVALELVITHEAIQFNRWEDVFAIGRELGKTVPYRINLDMTHLAITFAQATSYIDRDGFVIDTTTGDGLSIANSAHTLANSNITYRNTSPGNPQFSKTSLIDLETIARNNSMDNNGVPKVYNWTHIWCSGDPNNVQNIHQLLNSMSDNTQANPAVDNTYKKRYIPLILQQLDTNNLGQRDETKSNWWGIGAFSGEMTSGNNFTAVYAEWEPAYMSPAPSPGNNAVDFSRDIQKYGTRGAYGLAVLNGMGIVYSFAPNV